MGGRVWVNPIKQEHLWQKIFSDVFEWSSKKLWKIIFADAQASEKQQERKEIVTASQRETCDK